MSAAAVPIAIGLGAASLFQSERQLKQQRKAQRKAIDRQAQLVREAEERQQTSATRRRSTQVQEERLRAQRAARAATSGRSSTILTEPLGAVGSGSTRPRTILG